MQSRPTFFTCLIPLFRNKAGVLFLMGMILLPMAGSAQDSRDIDPDQQVESRLSAPVIVDGYELFRIRGVSSYPADARANTIEARIRKAALNPLFNPDSLKIVDTTDRIMIMAGSQLIVNIYEEDAEFETVSMSVLAELIHAKVKESIKKFREERQQAYIESSLKRALTSGLLLALGMIIFVFIFKRLNDLFKNRVKAKINKLENVSFKIIQSDQLFAILHFLYRLVRFIIILLFILFFADYILGLFPETRQVAKFVFDLLVSPLERMGVGFLESLPSLAFLLVVFLVTNYLLKLVRLFFGGIDQGEIRITNFDAEWAMPTFKIVKLLVVIFALVIAYPYIPGSSSSAFQGISVFLGVLFSLGSSSFIANIIAGYSMTYRRAFKKGDRIQVEDFMGFVQEQTLMVTRLRSVKNEEIIIPNSTLLNSNIKNYTQAAKERGIILHTSVGIGYETPWRLVETMLLEAASRTKGLLKDPPPYVLQKGLGDFAVTYEINAYCDDPINMYFMYTDLHRNILDVFNENNVQIMTPAYEGDPEIPKVVPKDQWNTPIASTINQNPNS